jgi:uncharacterized protein YeaO (DUF488 family)
MANLAPSEVLLAETRAGEISWAEFRRRYRSELYETGIIDRGNTNIKNHGQKFTLRLLQRLGSGRKLTLMCHCAEDEKYCHRHVLKQILLARI